MKMATKPSNAAVRQDEDGQLVLLGEDDEVSLAHMHGELRESRGIWRCTSASHRD
jgi:hypothetical protein